MLLTRYSSYCRQHHARAIYCIILYCVSRLHVETRGGEREKSSTTANGAVGIAYIILRTRRPYDQYCVSRRSECKNKTGKLLHRVGSRDVFYRLNKTRVGSAVLFDGIRTGSSVIFYPNVVDMLYVDSETTSAPEHFCFVENFTRSEIYMPHYWSSATQSSEKIKKHAEKKYFFREIKYIGFVLPVEN